MASYVMLGKYSGEALKGISARRTDEAKALIKKHGGELKAAYAVLGAVDLDVRAAEDLSYSGHLGGSEQA